MKIVRSLIAGATLISSPALAQSNTSATNTHVHTTTREIHETNVPVHHTTHHRAHHHAVHCDHYITKHGKKRCEMTHHVVVKKTVTTTTHS